MAAMPRVRNPAQALLEKIEDAVAHCDAATQENERVVDTIEELLSAGDSGRPDRKRSSPR